MKLEFPRVTNTQATFQPNAPEFVGDPIKLTSLLLKEIGAIQLAHDPDIWQIGLLQYCKTNGGYSLWDETNDWLVGDVIAVKYLHELQIQYFGLTFKQLNICPAHA
jgi:hypothetical protein